MSIEIGCRGKALDEGDSTGLGLTMVQSDLFDDKGREVVIDDQYR